MRDATHTARDAKRPRFWWRHWITWVCALVSVTSALIAWRASVSAAHLVLAYLVLVLGASARGGRTLGLTIAVLAFACFNFFFVPPYHTFAVAARLDWLVLVAFLFTSVVAAQLLARAQSEAKVARERAAEVDRLATLSATLSEERVRLAAAAEHADALREADRMKDALLLSVSHDLRTPLTTIKALAHDLSVDGDERAIIIEEEADRLNRFVADLLDLSRLAGGGLSVVAEINAAEDLLGAALQRTSGAAGVRTINVALDTAEPLLLGRFDFTHALRILVNLIENALKYSPSALPIDVTARRRGAVGEYLEFVVADRGAGVPETERERIFDPFYRPPGSPPDTGSIGLGLSIARRLAEAQDGTVYHQPRDGGGSCFVLRVPAADIAELSLS